MHDLLVTDDNEGRIFLGESQAMRLLQKQYYESLIEIFICD